MKVCFFCSLFVIVIEFIKLVFVLSWIKLSCCFLFFYFEDNL